MNFYPRSTRIFLPITISFITLAFVIATLLTYTSASAVEGVNEANLAVTKTSVNEPLVGGVINYNILVENTANTGDVLEDDKAYNIYITDTLPAGVSFVSANPTPNQIILQPDGTSLLIWADIQDLEQQESLSIDIVTQVDPVFPVGTTVVNSVEVLGREFPDGTGAVFIASDIDSAILQAIDIEKQLLQSTGVNQATGASGWESAAPGTGGGAEWVYQYTLSIQNNPVGATSNVIVTDILPAGIAYMGNPIFSANPNSVSVEPTQIISGTDLLLVWDLGVLATDIYSNPIEITFDTAIPYRERAGENGALDCVTGNVRVPNDIDAVDIGCFDGPIVPDHSVWHNAYEASGEYNGNPTSDGTISTPQDDDTIPVTAVFQTIKKSASVDTVAYGDTVVYTLTYYVSEYYTLTGSVITDVLPDGLSYVDGSASVAPLSVVADTPGTGQTTIVWPIDPALTTPGSTGFLTFIAETATTYDGLSGRPPLVAADSLINKVTMSGNFVDDVDPAGAYTGVTTDSDTAVVETEQPSIAKKVLDPDTGQWVDGPVLAKVGETHTFRLVYRAPAGVDARNNYLVDFMPDQFSFVSQTSCSYSGTISNTFTVYDTDQDPCTHAFYSLTDSLSAVRWNYGFVSTGFAMTTTIEVEISEEDSVKDGLVVRNILKASGINTAGTTYSLRDSALIEIEGTVSLSKTVTPDTLLDAGDMVTYTILYSNTGVIATHNHMITDTVPAGLIINTADCLPATCQIVGGASQINGAGGVMTWLGASTLNPGEGIYLTYTATISDNAVGIGAPLVNTATVGYNTRSDNSGLQTVGTSNPVDENTDTAEITPVQLAITKTLEATSEAHTTANPNDKASGVSRERLAIGEIARFRLIVEIPEGAYGDLVIRDKLPSSLLYLHDGTAKIAFVHDDVNGITSSQLSVSGCTLQDTDIGLTGLTDQAPECVVNDSAISSKNDRDRDSYNSGTDVYFRLGSVVNQDNDANKEYIVVELNAQVVNFATGITNKPQNHVTDAGGTRNNSGTLLIDLVEVDSSANVPMRIVEPFISLDKNSSAAGSISPFDPITYTIQFTNTGQGDNLDRDSADAFDVRFVDTLPPSFVLTTVITDFPGYVMAQNNSTASVIDYTLDQLAYEDTATFTITGYIDPNITPVSIITNSAYVTYTSLPGANGTTVNDTGSSVTPATGADYGERDGSGFSDHNDYRAADDAVVVLVSDFSDLPETYGTADASHIISGSLQLGSSIDTESFAQPSLLADGDGDDEDGVSRVSTEQWEPNQEVSLNVTVSGGTGRLVGWFDWNNDGQFSATESVDFGSLSGSSQVTLTVGSDYVTGTPLSTRFRLFEELAVPSSIEDAFQGGSIGGEIEDYVWQFTPTAVTLRNATADSAQTTPWAIFWVISFALLSLTGVVLRRRSHH